MPTGRRHNPEDPHQPTEEEAEELVAAALKVDPKACQGSTGSRQRPRSRGLMAERELVAVEWNGNESTTTIRLFYSTPPIERIPGDRVMAAQRAQVEGFTAVEPTPIHVGRWVKDP